MSPKCEKHGSVMTFGRYSKEPEFDAAQVRSGEFWFYCHECTKEIEAIKGRSEIQYIDDFAKDAKREDILRWIGENFTTIERDKIIGLAADLESKRRGGGYKYMAENALRALVAANWNEKAAIALMRITRVWK